MSEPTSPQEPSIPIATACGPPELEAFLGEIRDVPCAALFALVARQLAGLDADVQVEVRPLGLLFRYQQESLCELSLYGELFLARLGPGLSVEVRVRSQELAALVLDQVLRHLLRQRTRTQAVSLD